MTKCLNCDDNAVYIIEKRGHKVQLFCEKHLPWFWKSAKSAEGLKKLSDLVVKEEPKVEEKPKKEPKKKEEPIEEPIIEEVIVEEPKPEAVEEEVISEDREDNN